MTGDKVAGANSEANQPSKVITDAGRIKTSVYDCPERTTALGVAAKLRRALRAGGWQRDYSCNAELCGPPRGWAALMTELRATPLKGAYGYGLVSKHTSSGMQRLAFFTADLDDRPRVIVRTMWVNPSSAIKQELDFDSVKPLYANGQPLSRIHFSTGSSVISDAVSDVALSRLRINDGESAQWIVVGHADERGSESNNGLLAWRRAQKVSSWLMANGVSRQAMHVYSVGDLMPVAGLRTGQAALDANRRVDVFLLSESKKHALVEQGQSNVVTSGTTQTAETQEAKSDVKESAAQ